MVHARLLDAVWIRREDLNPMTMHCTIEMLLSHWRHADTFGKPLYDFGWSCRSEEGVNIFFHLICQCLPWTHQCKDFCNNMIYSVVRLIVFRESPGVDINFEHHNGRRSRCGLVGSVLAYYTKGQGSRTRPDIKTKYEKYFLGDFISADFWQKLWESICCSESTLNCRSRHLTPTT